MRYRPLLAAAAVLFATGAADAAKKEAPPAPATPQALFADCAGCHGELGQGSRDTGAPRIGGQHAWYLQRQLDSFRSTTRGAGAGDVEGHKMVDHASRLPSPAAVAEVVAYVSALQPPTPADTVEGDVRRGRTLYEASCTKCHGSVGLGNEVQNAPRLAGQHDWYLLAQIGKFQEGMRGSNPNDYYGQKMSHQAELLPDEQAVRDVIAWINRFE